MGLRPLDPFPEKLIGASEDRPLLVVLLCFDLQDSSELAIAMVRSLLERPELDAVLAVNRRALGEPLQGLARRVHDVALGLSSRRPPLAPNGFHSPCGPSPGQCLPASAADQLRASRAPTGYVELPMLGLLALSIGIIGME